MQIILVNNTDESHLSLVCDQMRTLGPPTIKAVWVEVLGAWVALEGSHRLAAALSLGLTPEIDAITDLDLEMQDPSLGLDVDLFLTVGEFAARACNRPALTFED